MQAKAKFIYKKVYSSVMEMWETTQKCLTDSGFINLLSRKEKTDPYKHLKLMVKLKLKHQNKFLPNVDLYIIQGALDARNACAHNDLEEPLIRWREYFDSITALAAKLNAPKMVKNNIKAIYKSVQATMCPK